MSGSLVAPETAGPTLRLFQASCVLSPRPKTFLINALALKSEHEEGLQGLGQPEAQSPWRRPAGPLLLPCVCAQEMGEHPSPDSSLSGPGWL